LTSILNTFSTVFYPSLINSQPRTILNTHRDMTDLL